LYNSGSGPFLVPVHLASQASLGIIPALSSTSGVLKERTSGPWNYPHWRQVLQGQGLRRIGGDSLLTGASYFYPGVALTRYRVVTEDDNPVTEATGMTEDPNNDDDDEEENKGTEAAGGTVGDEQPKNDDSNCVIC